MAFFRGMTGVSPVLGGVLAYGVYRVFYIEAGINGLGRRFPTQALSLDNAGAAGDAGKALGLLSWGVTGTFFFLAFIGTSIVLGSIIGYALRAGDQWHRWRVIGTITFLAVLAVFTRSNNPFAVNSFNPTLTQAFQMLDVAKADWLLAIFTPIMLIVVILLMCGAWATLSAEVRAGEAPGLHLRNQTRYINTALFAGAIMLVAGVVHAGAIHRLPDVLLAESDTARWDELIRGLSASTGAVWTFILLGIYLPTLAALHTRARTLAFEAVDEKTPEKIEKWLANHGLTFHFSQSLAQIGALLSPLLIGGPASPLIGIFGS
jgi:hypothetical protein